MQFLGMELDSIKMEVSLPQEKNPKKIRSQCQGILGQTRVKVRDLASLVGRIFLVTVIVSICQRLL